MKRIVLGVLIFFATLFVGVQVAVFVTIITDRYSVPADLPVQEDSIQADGFARKVSGIHISYLGGKESELRFLIYNGSTEKLLCYGQSGICMGPELRIDGLDDDRWQCMNGFSIYEVRPGDTVEMIAAPYDFPRLPGKNDKVEVGFRTIGGSDQDQHFAQPIVLPPAFRNEIRKYLSQFDEY